MPAVPTTRAGIVVLGGADPVESARRGGGEHGGGAGAVTSAGSAGGGSRSGTPGIVAGVRGTAGSAAAVAVAWNKVDGS